MTTAAAFQVCPAGLARLRALRLQAGLACCEFRHRARRAEAWGNPRNMSLELHSRADEYLRTVQALNDFFPLGDTAERDASDAIRNGEAVH